MFERQIWHYLILGLMLVGINSILNGDLLAGQFLGLSTRTWLYIAIVVPIVHQGFTWLGWRAELHHEVISRWLGRKRGFKVFAAIFGILASIRVLSILLLAISNRNTLYVTSTIVYPLAGILTASCVYTVYSVLRYFGVLRAMGIDHFDESYRRKPFVREGVFRFTRNGMYTFGLMGLWVPGLLLFSQAALLIALFNHAYIWLHYFCTELPDLRRIYGSRVK